MSSNNQAAPHPTGIDDLSQVLQAVHAKNLKIYQRLLKHPATAIPRTQAQDPFWDIVVITAGDAQQRKCYENRISEKLVKGLIPQRAKYHVIDDPPQSKIGSGGSTCLVMKVLREHYPADILSKVHAGGYSTRLPHISARGKIFMTIPQADRAEGIQILELKLVLYLHLLETMPPGVFLTSADGIELFSSNTPFPSEPKPFTITALAHPSSTQIGSTHGVYLLHDTDNVVTHDRDLHPRDQSALLLKCEQFLHKPSIDVMKSVPRVIYPDPNDSANDVVYTDSCYYFDPQTANLMADMYSSLHPECDLEAWADILSFQDQHPASLSSAQDSTAPSSLSPHVQGRHLVKQLLQQAGVSLDVMVLNASKFYHLGTMQEFLEGTCTHKAFMHELNIRNTDLGIAVVVSQPNDILPADTRNGAVQSPLYIENVVLAPEAQIHPCSIIVDSCLPRDAIIPKSSCVFTLQLQDREFVTFTFSLKDDMKRMTPASVTATALSKDEEAIAGLDRLYIFERVPVSRMLPPHQAHPLTGATVEAPSAGLSLWNAPVFEIARTAQESVRLALDRLDRIRNCLDGAPAEAVCNPDLGRKPGADIVGWISLMNAARKAREYE
uniref:GDP-L-fucose pyrophosphorylase n=1 Tax=Mortierella alpina TaxID=64518 RepID=A0A1R7T311_MORAP|nr:GDP-L-fucose pyrophosphorylase [Mortierella alpina]